MTILGIATRVALPPVAPALGLAVTDLAAPLARLEEQPDGEDPAEAARAHARLEAALLEATDARRWDVVAQVAGELAQAPTGATDRATMKPPATRGECASLARPCGRAACRYILPTGCALDVADRGGVTADEIGQLLGRTRQNIDQITARALGKLRLRLALVGVDVEDVRRLGR